MDNELLTTTKKLHDSLKEIIGDPYIQIAFMKAMPESSLKLENLMLIDPLRFMLYVANADGVISQREANIISYITGEYISLETLRQQVAEDKDFYVYSMPEVPLTIKVLCFVENAVIKNSGALDTSVLRIAIDYFKALGMLISDADGDVTDKEKERVVSYVRLIQDYAGENTLSPFF